MVAESLLDPALPLSDEESVFRRIEADKVKRHPDGSIRLSSQAFSDRKFEPSVDREAICARRGGAEFTRRAPENGVASVIVVQVRAERFSQQDSKGRPIAEFVADVHPDPCPEEEPENDAHCLIKLSPENATKAVFRRLIERLALLARIEILPGSANGS